LKAFIDIQYFLVRTEGNAIGGAQAIHQQGRLAIRVDAPQSASARFPVRVRSKDLPFSVDANIIGLVEATISNGTLLGPVNQSGPLKTVELKR
jgi:hypothetical protein